MSTLQGRSIATTYKDLLQVSNNNIGVDGTIRAVEDGEGTQSALALSTDTIEIRGPIIPSTNATFDIGSADRKIRHLYLSSNSLYVGDLQFSEQDLQEVKNVRGGAYATSAQGALAETALQPGAFSFGDLSSKPTTLAGYGITDAATAAQGDAADAALAKANTALQPGGVRFTNDVTDKPTTLAGYGITDAFDSNFSSLQGTPTSLAGYGITDAATSAQGDKADSALQPGDNIAFSNVTNTPTSLAGYGITDAATSTQGSLADTALQPGDSVSFSNITNTPVTLAGYGITNAATSTQGDKADTALQPDTEIHVNTVHLSGGKIFGPATMYIDPEAIGDNTGKLVILGDLQVDGVTTTVNSTTVSVNDKNFEIAKGATTSSQADGAGLLINPDISMLYRAITDSINFNKSVEVQGNLMLSDNSPEINLQTINPSHYNWRVAAQQIVDGGLEISVGDLDGNITDDTFDPLIVVKHTGNVGIGVTTPAYKLDVAGDINMTGALKVNGQDAVFSNWTNQNDGSISRASDVSVTGDVDVSGTMGVGEVFVMDNDGTLGGVTPTTVGQVVTWDGAKWIAADNAGGGGSSGPSEVPAAFSAALTQGQSVHTINFTKTYDTIPAVVTDLQITGDGDIIPYVITAVTTSSMTVTFASAIPNNNYKLNISFGGRDVFWNAGNLNTINYTDGNVGIGTANPGHKLDVVGGNIRVGKTSNGQFIGENSSGEQKIKLDTSGSSFLNGGSVGIGVITNPETFDGEANQLVVRAATHAGITVCAGNTTSRSNIYFSDGNIGNQKYAGGITYDHGDDDISFRTGGLERVWIDSAGNVGIGTTSPSKQLHIEDTNANTPGIKISASDQGYEHEVRAQGDGVLISADSTNYGGAGPDIRFNVSGSERMRIQKNGRVGIGTTNPVTILDINEPKNDSNGDPLNKDVLMSFSKGDTGEARIGLAGMTSQVLVGALTDDLCIRSEGNNIRFGTASATRTDVTIDTAGKVGIGTTSPEVDLHVRNKESHGQSTLKLQGNNTGGFCSAIIFTNSDQTDSGSISYNADDNYMRFNTGGLNTTTERLRIHNNGVISTNGITNPLGTVHFTKSGGGNSGRQLQYNTTFDSNETNGWCSLVNAGASTGATGVFQNNRSATIGTAANAAYNTDMFGLLYLQKESGGNTYLWVDNSQNWRTATSFTYAGSDAGGTVIGTQTSDERLKNISQEFDYGIEHVLQLQPITYTRKDDTDSVQRLGFGAQTTQQVIPEAVYDTGDCVDGYDTDPDDETKSVPKSDETILAMEYVQLVPVLTKAIQEQQTMIDELKAQNESLINRIETLENNS